MLDGSRRFLTRLEGVGGARFHGAFSVGGGLLQEVPLPHSWKGPLSDGNWTKCREKEGKLELGSAEGLLG